jgi:hypothetical protein
MPLTDAEAERYLAFFRAAGAPPAVLRRALPPPLPGPGGAQRVLERDAHPLVSALRAPVDAETARRAQAEPA